MNLPNYFLADLPPEATFTPEMIREACQTLKRNRELYLAGRTTAQIIQSLGELAANWLDADYPFRRLALEQAPAALGFSSQTLARGLDGFFSQLTRENLHGLLLQELGDSRRLDAFIATSAELKTGAAAMARGPELLAHVAAGNVPNPALMSLVLGLLARSAQFVKCARGSALLVRLFAHSLYEADPKLASCLEVAEWPGGSAELEGAVFEEADCVTATGGDETLADIRRRLPARARLLGYGHRVSFAYVAAEALSGFSAKKNVVRAADDVAAWDQLGCLSPHVLYVERGGGVPPDQFAALLAEELARREAVEPRGPVPVETTAVIASRRGFYEVRAAASPGTLLWCSPGSTAWTVVFEDDPRFQTSCLHRFIYVKAVTDLAEVLQHADDWRGRVSTVGLAAPDDKAQTLATQLARWGVTRVCPLGQMQNPPLTWRHDGRPALGDLVSWTNWEMS